MKLAQIHEARSYNQSLPGMYQRYDVLYSTHQKKFVHEAVFDLADLSNKWTQQFFSNMANTEFTGVFLERNFTRFYRNEPYVDSEKFKPMRNAQTLIDSGGDWGEGGDWWWAFDTSRQTLYNEMMRIIDTFTNEQWKHIYSTDDEEVKGYIKDAIKEILL